MAYGGLPARKMEALREHAAARAAGHHDDEAEKYKELATMWCKRALAAETTLAILVEGVVK